MKHRFILIGMILAWIAALNWQTSKAQFEGEEYFEETGHVVAGEFLLKYRSVSNSEKIFGFPITDAYHDPELNILVQYFQKARFELHTDAPYGYRVQLSNLGEWLQESGQELTFSAGSPACNKFPGHHYQICYAFLDFYMANGGEGLFGKPISNVLVIGNQMVQYFSKARFEWHPQREKGERVVLSDLGAKHFYREGNLIHELPKSGNDIIKGIQTLKVRAYPLQAVTESNGTQTVHIIVQDQRLLPVTNAQVILIVRMPAGQERRYIIPSLTNNLGITRYTFPFNSNEIGLAEILVIAMHNNLEANTTTSFRVWW
jgi:hypothetical protein